MLNPADVGRAPRSLPNLMSNPDDVNLLYALAQPHSHRKFETLVMWTASSNGQLPRMDSFLEFPSIPTKLIIRKLTLMDYIHMPIQSSPNSTPLTNSSST